MIKSMTGFGRGEFSDGKRNVIVEIKTVNHRYADITVKMPKRYSFAEEKIKGIVKQQMKRGKADVSIIVENLTEGDITFTPHGSHHGSWCEEGENYKYIWFELCTDGYPGNIS